MKTLLAFPAMIFFLTISAFAVDCVEVDIETESDLHVGVVYFFYAELTNCGDEGDRIALDVTVTAAGQTHDFPGFGFYLGAGETVSRSFPFVLPPFVPEGGASVCVTASKGQATSIDCVYPNVTQPGNGNHSKGNGRNRKHGSVGARQSGAQD